MERIIFEPLSAEVLTKGRQNRCTLSLIEELKGEYSDQKFNNSVQYVMDFLTERDASYSNEYIKRINEVNRLIGKYWKVSLLESKYGTDLCTSKELCYMYPYAMNMENNMLFAIVSLIDFDDYRFSKRRVFAEDSFNFLRLGDICAGLLFEEVDREDMIKHAENMVTGLLLDRITRNEAKKLLLNPKAYDVGLGGFFKDNNEIKIPKESAIEDIIKCK